MSRMPKAVPVLVHMTMAEDSFCTSPAVQFPPRHKTIGRSGGVVVGTLHGWWGLGWFTRPVGLAGCLASDGF